MRKLSLKSLAVMALAVVGFSQVAWGQNGWTVRNPIPPFKTLQSATWTGTRIVAVGDSGTIVTSETGQAWTKRVSGTGNALYGVNWNGTRLVAVGASGTVLSSPDGITWTLQSSSTNKSLIAVTSSATQFLAVGAEGTMVASTDGINWSARPSAVSTTLNGVAAGPSGFVAVGDGGVILSSANGTSWTGHTSGTGQILDAVAWVGSRFVVVGHNGVIRTSPDGSSWATVTSVNGNYLSAVNAQGSQFVAVGQNGTILTATDPTATWTARTSATTQPLRSVVWTGTRWVAVGVNGTIRTTVDPTATWTDPSPTIADLNGVTSSSTLFAAVGALGTVVTSADGIGWDLRSSGVNTILYSVAWTGTRFIAVGASGVIRVSTDGVTWSQAPSNTGVQLNGVTWTGTGAVAVGVGGVIRTSTDGLTWGGPGEQGPAGANALYAVTSNGSGRLVAVGQGGLVLSSDNGGTSWNTRLSQLDKTIYSVTFGGGQFVAVAASGQITTSPDGITWTKRTSGVSTGLFSVKWTGAVFVAGNSAGGMLLSLDGITWTPQATGTTYALNALAVRDTLLVAVGTGGAILTSYKAEAPALPNLTSPDAGASGVSTLVNLTWGTVSGATGYEIQVSNDAGFALPLVDETVTTNSKALSGLSNSTTYYWRVRAKNAILTGQYASRSFTTGVAPTAVPDLVGFDSPGQFEGSVSLSPTIRWRTAARASSYRLEVATNPDFSPASRVVNDSLITDTSRVVTGPLAGGIQHYWRVTARNQLGYGPVQPNGRMFTTLLAPPMAPVLTSPVIYSTGNSQTPTLAWDASAGATSYRVQLSASPTFNLLLVNDSVTTTSKAVTTPLTLGGTFYWRVTARNAAGSSPDTAVSSFGVTTVSILPGSLVFGRSLQGGEGRVTFRLMERQQVTLRLFDMQGRLVALLADERLGAGEHSIALPSGLRSSLYLLDFKAGASRQVIKVFP